MVLSLSFILQSQLVLHWQAFIQFTQLLHFPVCVFLRHIYSQSFTNIKWGYNWFIPRGQAQKPIYTFAQVPPAFVTIVSPLFISFCRLLNESLCEAIVLGELKDLIFCWNSEFRTLLSIHPEQSIWREFQTASQCPLLSQGFLSKDW